MHRSLLASMRMRRCSLRIHRAGHNVRRLASSVPGMDRRTAGSLSRGNVMEVNTHVRPNSVVVNGVAPGNRSSPSPRRGLLHTVFNSGTNSMGSTSLGTSPSLGNIMVSGGLFSHIVGGHDSGLTSGTLLPGVSSRFRSGMTSLGHVLIGGLVVLARNGISRNIGSCLNTRIVTGNSGFDTSSFSSLSFASVRLDG